jgi:hypothetical protein
LYLEIITALLRRYLARAYVLSSLLAAPSHLIVASHSEIAEKVKWYMGIVVEPKEVKKARYINKGKLFRSNERLVSPKLLNAGKYEPV